MGKLVQGIYNISNALLPVAGALLVLMLVIIGIDTVIGGIDAISQLKHKIKAILIGSAMVFGASVIGKEITSWFM